ncbi:MAG: metallophosphoesterase family protein [Chloroflexi bacterium]|jgi:predicted phosphodiesterase|nr:metallophosphoesterase family protein [Chloroflexota bacterium]
MRTLVISDIHANLNALEAVLAHAGTVNQVWFLGDVAGYGPDLNECVELLQTLPGLRALMGNHDAALMDYIPIDRFNREAAEAINVQAGLASQESRDFLELLQLKLEIGEITLAHGSPRNPIWEYILGASLARVNFEHFEGIGCLVGHSHVPLIFIQKKNGSIETLLPRHGDRWKVNGRFILNPGSVGQPRDFDQRASYVIWDDEEQTWGFYRVEYEIASVQDRIMALGIPPRQATRLWTGS